jgi:hypothetical protein
MCDCDDYSSPARAVVAGMKRRRRHAERTLRREAAHA